VKVGGGIVWGGGREKKPKTLSQWVLQRECVGETEERGFTPGKKVDPRSSSRSRAQKRIFLLGGGVSSYVGEGRRASPEEVSLSEGGLEKERSKAGPARKGGLLDVVCCGTREKKRSLKKKL